MAELDEIRKIRPYAQDFSGNSKTQQHFRDGADVNQIIRHFKSTGMDPAADRAGKQTFGYASSQTFSEALRATAEIASAFEQLPAEERSRFSNDPASWLDSLQTPELSPDEIVSPEASQEADPPSDVVESAEIDST